MEQTLEKEVHVWEGLTEYNLDEDDIFNSTEGGIEGTVNILKKMQPNQYYISKIMQAGNLNTNYFNKYIDELKSLGVDIGKGNCEYGYKMPLPEKNEDRRKLIIFRRRAA